MAKEVTFTVTASVEDQALFLTTKGADIVSGPFVGSLYVTNANGGAPIIYVKGGPTTWLPLQELITPWLQALSDAGYAPKEK